MTSTTAVANTVGHSDVFESQGIVGADKTCFVRRQAHNISAKDSTLLQPVSTDHLVDACSGWNGDR